jgi:uncharacterized damage-inducible protein DinB
MDAATRDRLVEDYLKGPQLLRQAITGMTAEQLKAKPMPGKWSTLEVLCHLADFEPVYVERMKRALAMEKPTLLGADETQFAQKLHYEQRDAQEELNLIDLTRRQMARILRAIPLEAWAREGVHNERGPMSVEKMVASITNHIPHHAKFISEKRQALGL